MNDKDRENIKLLCKKIEKKQGDGSVFTIDSKKSIMNIERWSTGIEDFDNAIGGGMPKGRMIEIFGPESSGKTSLAYHLCAQCEMALFIPAEGTFDAARAKQFGNKKGQLIVYRSQWGEDALQRALEFAEAGVPLIVIDSVPFLYPRSEYEKIEKDFSQELRIGGVARLLTKTMPALTKVIEKSGTTIVFINQIRDKMDAMMFGEKTQTPGGHSLKHGLSVRIQISRRSWIEVPNKDPKNSAANEKIGMISKIKVVKSKICNPYSEAELPMLFNAGYISHDDIKQERAKAMKGSSLSALPATDEEEQDEE